MSYPCFRQPALWVTAGAPECFVGAWESSGALSVPVLCSVGNVDNHGCMQSFYLLEGMPVHTLTYPLCNALAFAGLKGNCARTNLLPCLPQMMNSYTYLQEECMEREVIIFTVSFNIYCICLSLFLHNFILYFCNYFPISDDNIMALLLVTSYSYSYSCSYSYSTFPPGRRY